MDKKGTPRSITLPETIKVFRNLKNAKRFAIDIGGSLTKIAYYSTVPCRRAHYSFSDKEGLDEVGYEVGETSRLHFVKFETKYIEDCLDFVRANLIGSREHMVGKIIKATGGGAYKYAPLIQDKLGLKVDKEDEMNCLISGCNFLLKNISQEAFVYRRHADPEYEFESADPDIFPYMLVNIGSGVSIFKVESEESYERIGGTATGGGTFWGLGALLTKAKGFDELLELAETGDHRKTDLLVGDIYGGDYQALGLEGSLIASSFGKVAHKSHNPDFSDADVVRSLLFTISNDIGQIACLYAMMHNLKKVYFGGYFLRNHPLSMHTVSFSINYWSKGAVQSLFLRHEGYLGAIGAFLKGAEQCGEDYSWQENYAASSALEPQPSSGVVSCAAQLEMDGSSQRLGYCPLLAEPQLYIPDTADLNSDHDAREYWLNCFEGSIDKIVARAVLSQPDSDTADDRAAQFKEKYIKRLQHLRQQPFAYGNLTVRSLLDTIEHLLKEFDFPDPYIVVKQQENEAALSQLEERLAEIDSLTETRERWAELAKGVLAGNIFDWGARAVVNIMETSHQFGLKQAISKIPNRPWLIDDLNAWLDRVSANKTDSKPPHRHAAVFIDNSGVDVVLGVIPFVRELLKRGTRVTMCANTHPALNDVTHSELEVILSQTSTICPVIAGCLQAGSLRAMETAQSGPCLDLSRLSGSLVEAMRDVDLMVLEGMGRSVHTNLYAKFSCESLRIACIKNTWLAKRLGGDLFAAIFSYQPPDRDLNQTRH